VIPGGAPPLQAPAAQRHGQCRRTLRAAAHAARGGLQTAAPRAPRQEARFDRHFVRDLTWSRHQLEELAERRCVAAQRAAAQRAAPGAAGGGPDGWGDAPGDPAAATSFIDLFKKARRGAVPPSGHRSGKIGT